MGGPGEGKGRGEAEEGQGKGWGEAGEGQVRGRGRAGKGWGRGGEVGQVDCEVGCHI